MSDKSTVMEIKEHVRITETDPYGIAHHSSYAVWAEMGLRALLAWKGYKQYELASFDCKYLKSAKVGDEILIRVTADQGKGDGVFRFVILRGNTVLAQGSMRLR